jgi:hypothetical protein
MSQNDAITRQLCPEDSVGANTRTYGPMEIWRTLPDRCLISVIKQASYIRHSVLGPRPPRACLGGIARGVETVRGP